MGRRELMPGKVLRWREREYLVAMALPHVKSRYGIAVVLSRRKDISKSRRRRTARSSSSPGPRS
jgi:hypothetical protein